MDETTIPEDVAFRIQLPSFEGPLDLLLHLIKKHELDILDLPISFVTERYLNYLHMMQELDLDIASEYLLMAATLAHIKSKMLLPQNPADDVEEQDEGYQEDPRAQLIRRLLEYQKYRLAADQLGSRPIAGRDVFVRGVKAPEAQGPAPLASIDLYKLLDAFQSILKRVKGRVALEVSAEAITIQERMSQLTDLLRTRRACTFDELFATDRSRYEVVVTFLALLEMTKLRMTRIYQADPGSPLHVQYALLDDDAGSQPADLPADTAAVAAEALETTTDATSVPGDTRADAADLPDDDDDGTRAEADVDDAMYASGASDTELTGDAIGLDAALEAFSATEPAAVATVAGGIDSDGPPAVDDTHETGDVASLASEESPDDIAGELDALDSTQAESLRGFIRATTRLA